MLSTGLKIWIGSSMKKYKYIYYYVSIFYTIGISLWSGTIYLFMKHIGYTYGQINLFLGIFWVITFFAEIPSGYIADKVGYLKTIMFSGFVRGIGLLLLALSPRNLHWMVISGVLQLEIHYNQGLWIHGLLIRLQNIIIKINLVKFIQNIV